MATKTKNKTATTTRAGTTYTDALPLDAIMDDPDNERSNLYDLVELADSIRTHGLIEPIRVYPINDNAQPAYRLVSGHRRRAAAQLAGLQTLPAFITTPPDTEATKHTHRLIANIQRADLTDTEKARGYKLLMQTDPTLTQTRLAALLGISQSAIANSLRLLHLPTEVIELLDAGKLSPGHGIELLRIDSPTLDYSGVEKESQQEAQIRLAQDAVSREVTVRDLRQAIADRGRINSQGRAYQAEQARREKQEAERKAGTFVDVQAEKRNAKQEAERADAILRQKRRHLAEQAIRNATAIDPTTGPSIEHLRFTAHYYNDADSWQRSNTKETTTAITAATDPLQLTTILVALAFSHLRPNNEGTDLEPDPYNQTNAYPLARATWPITTQISEAIKDLA